MDDELKNSGEDKEDDKEASELEDHQSDKAESPIAKKSEELEDDLLAPLSQKAHQGLLKLYELIDDGTESVTNIREATIQNEIERQKSDDGEQSELKKYIAEKELEALEEYAQIDKRWEKISLLKDPLNIHNETIAQREKCNALLQQKDSVIEYLKETLKKKDETFLNEVDGQGQEIDLLIDRIEQQINTLKEAYIDQLESLEDIIDEEKKLMIDTNREKWELLIQEKDELDKTYLQKLCNTINTHEKSMLFSEKELNENRKTMRSKMEKNINDLMVQNDSLRSLCMLNVEKMNYNYQLLLKKQQDNKLIKQHSKRYCARMGTQLTNLQQSIEECSREASNNNLLYAIQFDKLNEAIVSLGVRHQDLAQSNAKIYFDLWNFNEKQAQIFVEQIVHCDNIIHKEILFMPWNTSNDLTEERIKPPSFLKARKLFDGLKKAEKQNKYCTQNIKTIHQQKPLSKRLMKIILDALISSCSFLIGTDLMKNELKTSCHNSLLDLENIFEILGVKSEEDSTSLMMYLLQYLQCPECTMVEGSSQSQETSLKEKVSVASLPDERKLDLTLEKSYSIENVETCLDMGHHPYVNPLDVNKAIRDFTADIYYSKKRFNNIDIDEICSKTRITPSQMIEAEDVTAYWKSFTSHFSPTKIHLWETLASSIHRYQKALHKRHNLKHEVRTLQRSNREMRRLLQRFIQDSPEGILRE